MKEKKRPLKNRVNVLNTEKSYDALDVIVKEKYVLTCWKYLCLFVSSVAYWWFGYLVSTNAFETYWFFQLISTYVMYSQKIVCYVLTSRLTVTFCWHLAHFDGKSYHLMHGRCKYFFPTISNADASHKTS